MEYELEEKDGGVLAVTGKKKPAGKRVLAAVLAALGIAFEFIIGLPIYFVIAAIAVLMLPAALVSRAKRRSSASVSVG